MQREVGEGRELAEQRGQRAGEQTVAPSDVQFRQRRERAHLCGTAARHSSVGERRCARGEREQTGACEGSVPDSEVWYEMSCSKAERLPSCDGRVPLMPKFCAAKKIRRPESAPRCEAAQVARAARPV